jgi:ATP adenylyltransferase
LFCLPQFEVRVCPALQDKAKAKQEADAKVGKSSDDEAESKKSSPFEPPYIEDLFVGDVEGTEGEEGMVMLVSRGSLGHPLESIC